MKRKAEPFDHTTRCTECGYRIQPAELMRVGDMLIRCPKCGKDFTPEIKGWSQLGGVKP